MQQRQRTTKRRQRTGNKLKERVLLSIVIPFVIAMSIVLGMFSAFCSVMPSASESLVEDYKKAAEFAGCTWQELIVYDTVRLNNELDDVNAYLSASDFLKMYYEKWQWVDTEEGGYWELVSKGTLTTPESICKWLSLNEGSEINTIMAASKNYIKPEYVVQFNPKDLDTLIIEKNFTAEQIELADLLMTSGILEQIFGDVYDLPDYIVSAEGGYFAWPTPELHTVTSKFAAVRLHPVLGINRPHNGVDISGAKPMGSPVISIEAGTVIMVDTDGGERGLNIKVQHKTNGDIWVSRYQHLSVIKVSVGDKVDRGTVVGGVGNSGIGTGPHLHIELTYNGVLIDPLPLIQSRKWEEQ